MLDPQKAIDLENGVNQGVVAPTEEELQKAGDASGLNVVNPSQNWDTFLPDLDPQSNYNFDTLGCNIFSGTHCTEALDNLLSGGKAEYSERAACVLAGLNGSSGSSEVQWENMLSSYGLIPHDLWPFSNGMTRAEFFSQVPQNIQDAGKNFLSKYDVSFRSVGTDLASLKEALKYAPVKIFIGTGFGWNQGEPNVIQRTGNPMGHAVMVRYIDSQGIHIYDQYAPFLKVLAPDYRIYYAYQTILTEKIIINPNHMKLVKDTKSSTVGILTGNNDKRILAFANVEALGLLGDEPQTPMDFTGIPVYNIVKNDPAQPGQFLIVKK